MFSASINALRPLLELEKLAREGWATLDSKHGVTKARVIAQFRRSGGELPKGVE